MATLSEIFCEQHKCSKPQFVTRLFWRSLYPHAWPFAPLLLLVNRDHFSADRALILGIAEADTMRRVREEVRDYYWDSSNRGWLRRVAHIRISGQRLKNIARRYLPEGAATSPPFTAGRVSTRTDSAKR